MRHQGSASSVARALLLSASIGFVTCYLVVAIHRLTYPFELEWMEGGMVDQVNRVVGGLPLYVAPSPDFVAYIYTPLYFWAAAGAAAITGPGFLPLRLVSILASCGIFAVIAILVRQECNRTWPGLVAAGLFAACYRASGMWLDLGRVDTFALFLVLGGCLQLRRSSHWRGDLLAALWFAAAFLAKQSMLVCALPLVLYAVRFRRGWERLAFGGALFALVVGSILIANQQSDGWFAFYVFELPLGHAMRWNELYRFWYADLLIVVGPALAVSAVGLWGLLRRNDRPTFWYYVATTSGMLAAALSSRIHAGGYINVLMPLHAGIAVLFGLGAHELFSRSSIEPSVRWGGILACLIQFGALVYDPRAALPSARDEAAWHTVVEQVTHEKGDVLVVMHGNVDAMAGKKSHAHSMAVRDVLLGSREVGPALRREFSRELGSGRIRAVVMDDKTKFLGPWFNQLIETYYQQTRSFAWGPDDLWPTTGIPTRPETVWSYRGAP